MGDSFSLQGSYTVAPLSPPSSADFDVLAQIDEKLTLDGKQAGSLDLTVDTPVVVPFGGVANAHVVILKTTVGTKVKATITTSDGAAQVIPFESLLILLNFTTPVTAISLTRSPAVLSTVKVLLAEKA